jgi:hypothetical protein
MKSGPKLFFLPITATIQPYALIRCLRLVATRLVIDADDLVCRIGNRQVRICIAE